ncbi:surface lipoprotein assembly modifier [Neisseria gonorrhoeae]
MMRRVRRAWGLRRFCRRRPAVFFKEGKLKDSVYRVCRLCAALCVWGAVGAYAAGLPDVRDDAAALRAQRAAAEGWAGMPPEGDSAANGGSRVIDGDFLLSRPQLLEHVLRDALNGNQADLIASLADLYAKLPDYDAVLYGRARALLAKLAGRPAEAAKLDLPAPVLENVGRFRKKTEGLTGWHFSGGISPSVNKNANNAAPQYCLQGGGSRICSVTGPVRAAGLDYEAGAEKLTALADNHYLLFRANVGGTSYYFSRKSAYDDAFGRAYLGWQYKNARQTVGVLPFYQAQLSGSDGFDAKTKPPADRRLAPYMLAHGAGVQLAHSYRLSRRSQLSVSLERYRQRYREQGRAERNDGWQDGLYVSLARRLGGSATVFGGWQFARFVPKRETVGGAVNNAAYRRNAVHIGWAQEWGGTGGLNSRIAASYAHRNYKGIAAFSTEAQRNREWNVSLALSHDKLSYKGIVPTLNYRFGKTESNVPYAKRRNSEVFVSADWRF